MLEEALKKNHLSIEDAVRLGLELAESCHGRGNERLRQCREIIRAGAEAKQRAEHSVSFTKALETLLQTKSGRRKRTLQEIRSITGRILRHDPTIATTKLSKLQYHPWQKCLRVVFASQRQQNKARVILHSLFKWGEHQGWCHKNPMQLIPHNQTIETEIRPLGIEEIRSLLHVAQQPEHRPCMAALGIMLWAGIRPAEIERLTRNDIDLNELVINIRPSHSKTGGSRHVPIAPVLAEWLKLCRYESFICPPNWQRRWKALRRCSGIIPWPQDILRHTFASYHLKRFHNLDLLQIAMGHRSAALLQTRYLNMQGLTNDKARQFWDKKAWRFNS